MADNFEITGRVGSSVRAVSTPEGIGLRTRAHSAGVTVDMSPDDALQLGEWLVDQARTHGAGDGAVHDGGLAPEDGTAAAEPSPRE